MKALKDLTVLFTGPASSLADELLIYALSEGASISACSPDALSRELLRLQPTVVVADLRGALDAAEIQSVLRPGASAAQQPVVALIDKSAAGTELAGSVAYNKYITVPAHPADIVAAIASLAVALEPVASQAPSELSLAALLTERAQRNDMRGFLALLNSTGPFRFTSILRFDEDEQLSSVWTFDRENRSADTFPVDATTPSSYCALVRESGAPFAMADSTVEPRAEGHPKQHVVLSYCGVPLYDKEQTMVGTLCSYDLAPRFFADSTIKKLEETAAILRDHAPPLRRQPASQA